MTMPLDPQALQELAAGYVLGDLNSEEAEHFHQLMEQEPSLKAEVAALQETLAMMPYGLTAEKPTVGLRSRILTAMEQEQPQSLNQPSKLIVEPVQNSLNQNSHQKTPSSTKKVVRPPFSPPFSRPIMWGSIAAGLLLAFGLGRLRVTEQPLQTTFPTTEEQPIVEQPIQQPLVQTVDSAQIDQVWAGFSQLLQDHRQALNNPNGPVDFVTAQTSDILVRSARFQTTAAALPMLPEQQGKLLGSSDCEFGKTVGLRLSYQVEGYPDTEQIVSAYQLDLNGDQFPKFRSSYITLRQPDGTSLVLWREESYLYALVAELPLTDLNNLAQSISRI